MVKTHTTITLDVELLKKAKTMDINISGSVNDYLSTIIAKKEGNIEGINIELERINRKKIIDQITNKQAELQVCESNINRYEELKKQKEEADLKKEKERIEASKKCINCGKIMTDVEKKNEFKKGFVCNSCFMTAEGKQIRGWNKDE